MDRRLLLVALIIFTNVLGVGLILPLLPYYAERLGASPVVIGLFIASFAFCALLAGPPLGRWSDRYGRKPILLLSLAGTALGFFLLGVAETLPVLFLARIIDGLSAGNTATAQAVIADLTAKEQRVAGMGIIFAASSLGLILGPTMGGLYAAYGAAVPAYVACGIALLSLLLTLFFLPETRDFNQQATVAQKPVIFSVSDFRKVMQQPALRWLLFIIFVVHLLIMLMWGTFSLYAKHLFQLSSQQVGYISAFAALVGITAQTGLIKVVLRLAKEEVILTLALFTMSLGLLLLAISETVALILVGVGLMAACYNIAMPIVTGLTSKLADEHEQGQIMGTISSLMNAASLIGPVLANIIYSFSSRGNYLVASLLGVLATLFTLSQIKR